MVFTQNLKLQPRDSAACDITELLNGVIASSGIREGILVVQASTAAAGLLRAPRNHDKALLDIKKEMRRLVPARINFANEESPENAAGCVKGALFGAGLTCVVMDGKLAAGDDVGVFFVDYDGPKDCVCPVCVIGE